MRVDDLFLEIDEVLFYKPTPSHVTWWDGLKHVIEVVNIVATTHLKKELDLELLTVVLDDVGTVKYDPSRFPGLILRVNGVAYLIFRTGKVVIVGCKNEEHIHEAVKKLVKYISRVISGIPEKLTIQIQNIVMTAELGHEVDLETLSEKLEHVIYVPEEFPGLIYKSGVGKPSALIFSTGKVVIVGASSVEDAEKVIAEIESTIKK